MYVILQIEIPCAYVKVKMLMQAQNKTQDCQTDFIIYSAVNLWFKFKQFTIN